MRADRQRWELIAVLVIGAVVAPFSNAAAIVLFLCAAALFLRWRKTALAERRGRVFDREAKTGETRSGTDR